jgi:hypothetical protein
LEPPFSKLVMPTPEKLESVKPPFFYGCVGSPRNIAQVRWNETPDCAMTGGVGGSQISAGSTGGRRAGLAFPFCIVHPLAVVRRSGCRFWRRSHRHLASGLSANPENRYHPRSSGLVGLYGTGTNNREVSRESSLDQFGRWRCALRRHVGTGIRDAHEQSRRCSERPRAKPKRALCVQSVPVPMATELLPRLRLWVVLRLWTKLLRL